MCSILSLLYSKAKQQGILQDLPDDDWFMFFFSFCFFIAFYMFFASSDCCTLKRIVRSPICRANRDKQLFTITFTPTGNLKWPFDFFCMFLICQSEPDYSDETYTGIGRTWKLHTKWAQSANRFEPRTFCFEATVLTTAAPCCKVPIISTLHLICGRDKT